MPAKIRDILIILFWIFMLFKANAQTDTVYVYEDVIVYDTIVVYDTVFIKPDINNIPLKLKSINLLQLDTITHQASLLLISDQQTATFLINHIIPDENLNKNIKNSESMKKLNFLGVVFFAFQAMVLAQTNYEVTVGSGIWWENSNLQYVDVPYSPLINAGVYVKRNFTDKNLGLKTGLLYSYLFSTGSYKFDGTEGVWHSQEGYEFEDLNIHYGSGFHNISIPLLLYYSKYKIQPFIGLNYNYLVSGLQNSSSGTEFFTDSHNAGINAGIGYSVSGNFSVNLEYKHNLTYDYGESIYGSADGQTIIDESRYFRNNQITVSLLYKLHKKQE